MTESRSIHECSHCHSVVDGTDEFCPACGALFLPDVHCHTHPARGAAGACIICCLPYCGECAVDVQGHYLCGRHRQYEIYQGMARVFGESDPVHVAFAQSCLENAGMHPFIYSRKASPLSMGSPEYTLFGASGEYDGHIINEYKLMVPCHEVAAAEETLRELEFIT